MNSKKNSSKRVPDKTPGPVPKKLPKLLPKPRSIEPVFRPHITRNEISFLGLPEKIKTNIIKFLPLVDRKTLRRVCRRCFYACCPFEVDEKLCIRSEDRVNTDFVLSTLLLSNRRNFRLEFHSSNFTFSPLWEQFWMTFGSRILSLKLETENVEPLSKNFCLCFVEQCSRLERLEIYVNDLAHAHGLMAAAQQLTDSCFENQSPLTLEIILLKVDRCVNLGTWRNLHQLLFSLFPNIANFPLCRYDERFENEPFQDYEQKRNFLHEIGRRRNEFDVPYERDRMVKLVNSYALPDAVRSISMSLLTIYPSTVLSSALAKITDLVISSDDEDSFPTVLEGFQKLTEITYVESRHCPHNVEVLCTLMPHILRIPTLRRLRISLSKSPVRWNLEWIEKISSSNIESIYIVCTELTFEGHFSPACSCPNMTSFTIDALESYVDDGDTIIKLLEAFPKLKILHLSSVNANMLEFICSTMIEVESLTIGKMFVLNFCDTFEYITLNLQNLKRLKRLEIPENLNIRGNKFTDLKCLLVTGMHNVERELHTLEIYHGLSLSLEVAWFDRFILPVGFIELLFMRDIINEFLKHYPKLRLFYLKCYDKSGNIHEAELKRQEDMLPTFHSYPSLQIFAHNKVYVRNRTSPIYQLADEVPIMNHDLMQRSPLILRPN